jgi:8-oxo-dGTP pyrophosphatase MutT (NUDIX family)
MWLVWSVQGGWEDDESVEEAACREAFEEAGVKGIINVRACLPPSLSLSLPLFPGDVAYKTVIILVNNQEHVCNAMMGHSHGNVFSLHWDGMDRIWSMLSG